MDKWQKNILLITAAVSLTSAYVIYTRGQVFPIIDISKTVELFKTKEYLYYSLYIFFGYLVSIPAFVVLYEIANKTKLALWGTFFCIFGTIIAIPVLGIFTFAFPELVNSLEEEALKTTIENIVAGPSMIIGLISAILYTLGPILLAISLFKRSKKLILAAIMLGVHGVLLSFGFTFLPLLVLGWALFGIALLLVFKSSLPNINIAS